jgi:four helix bundle protein
MHTLNQSQFSFERLDVWRVAMEALREIKALEIGRFGDLKQQLERASLSIAANLAEGVGKNGADQKRFFGIARGSTYESAALVESAHELGLIDAEARMRVRTPLLRVAAMLTRMTR